MLSFLELNPTYNKLRTPSRQRNAAMSMDGYDVTWDIPSARKMTLSAGTFLRLPALPDSNTNFDAKREKNARQERMRCETPLY